jgi:serine/threonine protein phosphatase PrpC
MSIWDRLFRREKGTQERASDREQPVSTRQRADPLGLGQATDIGKVRKANEDAFFTLKCLAGTDPNPLPVGLLIVADGMGGHVRGKEASSMSIRVASSIVVEQILLPLLQRGSADAGSRPIQEVLTEATASANEAVARLPGDGGTTLTSAFIMGHSAYVAHVGDSRVYYLHEGELQQITHDHSLVNRLVELGQIQAEEAQYHPQRNLLYRAVGQGAELNIDIHSQRLAKGSCLLVCSDGLWNQVTESEMIETIEDSSSAQEACNRLIDQAIRRGGEDNITVVLAEVNY